MEQQKQEILDATIQVFNEKGLKFTMDDLAKKLGISKKTIYVVIQDKEALCLEMVDYCFDAVKESERQIQEDMRLDTEEKIRRILGAMPDSYKDIDFRKVYQLKEKYPKIYKKVEQRLETGWETTIALLEQGMTEGIVRSVPIPLVKTMFEAALEQFFRRDVLVEHDISYADALVELVEILMYGIVERQGKDEADILK